MNFLKNGMENLMGLGFGAAVPGLRDSVKNIVSNVTTSDSDQKAKIQAMIDADRAEQQKMVEAETRPQGRRMRQSEPVNDGGYRGYKKGGKVDQPKKALTKAGFYDKDKTTSERKKIVSKVTTKPQRLGMVEKMFSAKKMKSGGAVSSASKRADGCAVRGKTRA